MRIDKDCGVVSLEYREAVDLFQNARLANLLVSKACVSLRQTMDISNAVQRLGIAKVFSSKNGMSKDEYIEEISSIFVNILNAELPSDLLALSQLEDSRF
jgi:hypothetical protein